MQPQGGKNQHAQDNIKGSPGSEIGSGKQHEGRQTKGTRAQTEERGSVGKEKSAQENNMKSDQPKGMKAQTEEKGSAGKDMKAEGREDRNGMKAEGREDRNGMKAEGRENRNGNMNAESKGATENRSQTDRTGGRRCEAFKRAAHQDHYRDQGPARGAGHQRQFLDFGRHPRSARRVVPPAADGDRDHLSGLARL